VRIAFFGLPLAAWLLHRDGHEIVYAGLSRTSPGARRLKRVLSGRPVVSKPDVTAPQTIHLVRSLAPERIVSWFWTTKLPPELLAVAPKGAFGVHPSLLPRHRGPDPYFWAVDSGDEVTGVTAHLLAGEYDTGGVVAQRTLAIEPDWNAWQLARALDRPSLALLRAVAGEPVLRATPQDEARATLAPAPADDELEIDWKWTSDRIVRRIRAAAPSPGAWSFFGEEPVSITRAAPAPRFPRALVPGEAAVIDGVGVVRTGDGAVTLLRGRMDARTDAADSPPYELDAGDLADLIESIAKRGLSPSIGD
jgi:methionyl-tRNA formyltransferase